MNRIIILIYGGLSYLAFLGTFSYAIGFVGNFAVPRTIDGPPEMPWGAALAVNLGLLSLFAVQHSVMARPAFKRLLTRILPEPAERSTFVLASSLALIALFYFWQPLGGVVWRVEQPWGRMALYTGFAFGWALVFAATVAINHFDLFGLRQSWRSFRGLPQSPLPFSTPVLYRIVRHPLYAGLFFAFWSTPTMTVTHLLFAVVTTAYILVAIQWEEEDLMDVHPEYAAYRSRVPMLLPKLVRKAANRPPVSAAARH